MDNPQIPPLAASAASGAGAQAAPSRIPAGDVPQVGSDVWYHDPHTGVVWPAKVTKVRQRGRPDSAVDLCVFTSTGATGTFDVPYGRGEFAHWSWPGEES